MVFRDLYLAFGDLQTLDISGLPGPSGDRSRLGPIGPGVHVAVQGVGVDPNSTWRFEGGLDQWVVNCACGTMGDDGERMVCCDKCEVWMHTRCVGVRDEDAPPARWCCPGCAPTTPRGGGGARAASASPRPSPRPAKKRGA